jgi:hypothetical protein
VRQSRRPGQIPALGPSFTDGAVWGWGERRPSRKLEKLRFDVIDTELYSLRDKLRISGDSRAVGLKISNLFGHLELPVHAPYPIVASSSTRMTHSTARRPFNPVYCFPTLNLCLAGCSQFRTGDRRVLFHINQWRCPRASLPSQFWRS